MKKILLLLLFIIGLGIALLIYILKNSQEPGCGVKDYDFYCGTASYNEVASEGRSLFNTNCAACHKLNKNMTGPALKDVGKKYDSITIVKYLHGKKSLITEKGYNNDCMVFKNLKKEDIFKILEYTNH
jgi:cytochrome c553